MRKRLRRLFELLEDTWLTLQIAWEYQKHERRLVKYLRSPEGRRKYSVPDNEKRLH